MLTEAASCAALVPLLGEPIVPWYFQSDDLNGLVKRQAWVQLALSWGLWFKKKIHNLHDLCLGTVGFQEVAVFEKIAEPIFLGGGGGALPKEVGHKRWTMKFHSPALFCIHTLPLYWVYHVVHLSWPQLLLPIPMMQCISLNCNLK